MKTPTTERKMIEVQVTHDKTVHSTTRWNLFSQQPSEYAAYLAARRAFSDQDYTHVRVVTTVTLSRS